MRPDRRNRIGRRAFAGKIGARPRRVPPNAPRRSQKPRRPTGASLLMGGRREGGQPPWGWPLVTPAFPLGFRDPPCGKLFLRLLLVRSARGVSFISPAARGTLHKLPGIENF